MIDLGEPAYKAIMTHAEDRELRREVYTAYVTRASDQGPTAGQWDNGPLILEMLDLRFKLARLLGFDNWVEYSLSRRMAGSATEVSDLSAGTLRQGGSGGTKAVRRTR